MIDHLVLNVRDLEKSRKFYEQALAPLGYSVTMSFPGWAGFGASGKTDFWLAQRDPIGKGVHVAFRCQQRKAVEAFYAAAMKAGGTDHGKPGVREDYHPNYYAAFVLDPEENNIEAVCHEPAN